MDLAYYVNLAYHRLQACHLPLAWVPHSGWREISVRDLSHMACILYV